MKEYSSDFSVDIDKVIAAKSQRIAKLMPGFVKSYIKRLIHQREINEILDANREFTGCEFVRNALSYMKISYKAKYVDEAAFGGGGRYIFVSNHPLGGLDGLVLMDLLGSRFGKIKFVVNDFLMYIKPLEPLFVPVNKVGNMGKEYVDPFHEAYASDAQILYFPAGLCSRKVKGEIRDVEWKKSFVKHAVKYGRQIVPIFFSGKNSNFFYRLANLRKRLGIKFNIEMCFLPDEMFRQTNSSFNVVIGEPVSIDPALHGREIDAVALQIREKAYSLGSLIEKKV